MQDTEKKIRVAITHGDMNGIGYELMIRTFEDAEILDLFTPIVYGSEKSWTFYSNMLGVKCPCNFIRDARDARDGNVNIVTSVPLDARVEMGKKTPESNAFSHQAVERALEDYAQGLFDVMVMAPGNNDELDFISDTLQKKKTAEGDEDNVNAPSQPLVIVSNNNVNFASVVGKKTIDDTRQCLTIEAIVERSTAMRDALRRDLRENNPRVAMLALNDSITTDENSAEMSTIAPAVSLLVNSGVQVFGPYSESDLLEDFAYTHYDGILGMYDGQCESIRKKLFDDNGFVLYSGLGLVVTSPQQGPSFEICGKGIADASSFRSSIFAAIDVYRNRICYDIPLANPLQKIYHERREDGEKVRFAVKKKDFAESKSGETAEK